MLDIQHKQKQKEPNIQLAHKPLKAEYPVFILYFTFNQNMSHCL